jgi:lipopolysaccharide transport system ATP-binding protein
MSSDRMSSPAIVVHELSKRYRLGTRRSDYGSLRESVARAAARPVNRLLGRTPAPTAAGYLWALRDVSFEIMPGETVGIIGRNGAGKSTLLKVLSRITRPTAGWVEVRGRVGSLLEVGTGFHPELTGSENIFLNGAILGMKKMEIRRRFDDIVDFAEVHGFLDTPVKRYSSGMRVRLAFAVAAHFEPELLIVDEVLAVGDLAFQRKCIGKMGEVTAEGRTVLFVSHNTAVMQTLCRRGILLEDGAIVTDAPVGDAVAAYLRRLEQASATSLLERRDRRGWQHARLREVHVTSTDPSGILTSGAGARFRFDATATLSRMSCSFTVLDHVGNPVMTLSSLRAGPADGEASAGDGAAGGRFECLIEELPLVPGRYRVDVALHGGGHRQDEIEAAAFIEVADGLLRGRAVPAGSGPGPVVVAHRWTVPTLDGERPWTPAARDPVDAG